MKKWEERKKELESLYEDLNVAKVKSGDYNGIVKILKKFLVDPHISVSHSAIKACGHLAKVLKEELELSIKELIVILLARFKEKKTIIIDDTQITL
jgi:hypothetical protein